MKSTYNSLGSLLVIPVLFISSLGYAQVIEKKEKITIPEPPATSKVFTSGQNITYRSWETIEILPETEVQAGAELTFEIYDIGTPPAVPAANLNMNWVLSRIYGDNGAVTAEKKSFYNRQGLLLQTQSRNITAGHVLASQTMYDALGRPAINTNRAPIMNAAFSYQSSFVINSAGAAYSYREFDDSKLNVPDVVGNSTIGTLGWYYSNNNTLEPYIPATGYPYSRTDYYNDGSERPKRYAGVGEVSRMGQGHETSVYTTPIGDELLSYYDIRKKFFPEAIGDQSPYSVGKISAEKAITVDENGQQNIEVTSSDGNVLMTATPGSDYSASFAAGELAKSTFPYYKIFGYEVDVSSVTFQMGGEPGTGYIYNVITTRTGVTKTLVYSGNLANVSGTYSGYIIIESNTPFSVTYSAQDNNMGFTDACNGCAADVSPLNTTGYFSLLVPSSVSVTGGTDGYKIYNMKTEQEVSATGLLPAGYYKVTGGRAGVTVSGQNRYGNITYNFYNQAGQLVASISPEGVKKLISSGLSAFSTRNDLPYTTLYEYNLQNQLISTTGPDKGRSEFVYRKDGKVRFSQNAEQRNRAVNAGYNKPYNYNNYDRWGRLVESGEIIPAVSGGIAFNISTMSNLEDVSSTGGLGTGTKIDWVKTVYDVPVSTGLSGYTQDEITLRRNVSYTENAYGVKAWYNYDDQDRIAWTVKEVPNIGKKTVHYSYNSLNKVVKVVYQPGTPAETFVHFYEFDADQRLEKVYTNTSDNSASRKLQAQYYYYLTGSLKRIELGGNVQGIDYTYNAQGLVKAINHSNRDMDPGKDGIDGINVGFGKDVFGMNLEYYNGDYTRSGTNIGSIGVGAAEMPELYNGMPKAISWHSRKPASVIAVEGSTIEAPVMYGFTYDKKYQLNAAIYGSPNFATAAFAANTAFSEKGLTYDDNGNIRSLERTNKTSVKTDAFTYNYINNTNKLQNVANGSSGSTAFTYNEIGQLKTEVQFNGVTRYMKYDAGRLLAGVYADAALTQPRITFAYDAAGIRILKKDWVTNTTTYYVPDAMGNIMAVYNQTGTATATQTELPVYAVGRMGVFRKAANLYEYELSDNLGNVRVVIDQNLLVKRYSDYYPFGSISREGGTNDYRYGFQGQFSEKDGETGWNAFAARAYDSRLGRWTSGDPSNQFASPYTAMGNMPTFGADPDGRWFHLAAGFIIGAGVAGYKLYTSDQPVGLWEGTAKVLYGGGMGFLTAAAPGLVAAVAMGGVSTIGEQLLDNAFDKNKKLTQFDYVEVGVSAVASGIGYRIGKPVEGFVGTKLTFLGVAFRNKNMFVKTSFHYIKEFTKKPWWFKNAGGIGATVGSSYSDVINKNWLEDNLKDIYKLYFSQLFPEQPNNGITNLPEVIIRVPRDSRAGAELIQMQ